MLELLTWLVKAAVTVVLLVFVLGFGAVGMCAMNSGRGDGLLSVLVLLVAGAAVWGLVRMIIGLWKSSEDHRYPPADDA